MRRFIAFLLVSLLLVSTVEARPRIAVRNRLENNTRPLPGICWWVCAQMIGNEYDIKPLQTICAKVAKSGIGYEQGAGAEDIDYWLKKLKVWPRVNYLEHSQKGVNFLTKWLDRDLPVIAHINEGKGGHAIILMEISSKKFKWDNGTTDYCVYIIDPNNPWHEVEWSWSYFYDVWLGTAYVFDPAEQEN
jgi:Papain-like cysteine protease AvrRpt2